MNADGKVSNGHLAIERGRLDETSVCDELDRWVCSRPDSTPFHRPAWVKAVARGARQKAHCLVARTAGNAIAGILPLNAIHSPLFGRALVSSGFAVDGGILADDPLVAQELAMACWQLAQSLSCSTAELRGGAFPTSGWTVKSGVYLNFKKALEPTDEAQLLAVPKKHRAELRKGLNNDLSFVVGRDPELLDILYRLYAENVLRLGTPVFPKALFANVLEAFNEDADIVVVSHRGTPVSSVLSLYHNGACLPFWHGASRAARALRSNEVAYFRLMSRARERGCTTFDFGRSKVGTGPAAWKKTWGWEGQPISYAVRTSDGCRERDINPLSPQYRRKVELWKKLPLSVANLVGPHISRGLG